MLVHLQHNIKCSLNVAHGLKCYSFFYTEMLPRPVSSDAVLWCTGSLSLSEQVYSSQAKLRAGKRWDWTINVDIIIILYWQVVIHKLICRYLKWTISLMWVNLDELLFKILNDMQHFSLESTSLIFISLTCCLYQQCLELYDITNLFVGILCVNHSNLLPLFQWRVVYWRAFLSDLAWVVFHTAAGCSLQSNHFCQVVHML